MFFLLDFVQFCYISAVQKIKKLSETPVTVHNIAKLCVIDGKNREITKKLVQPVPPHPCWTHGNFNGKMTKKIKWPKITFPGSKMIPKVSGVYILTFISILVFVKNCHF